MFFSVMKVMLGTFFSHDFVFILKTFLFFESIRLEVYRRGTRTDMLNAVDS